jgi:acetyl-CoA synthetase
MGGITPTKPGSASLPFFGIEPAIIDPVSGDEIHGNDVEGVLAFKQPWPSMARTVWGAHKRYMDTYLNVYKGYYVSLTEPKVRTYRSNICSSLETVPDVTTRATTGSEDVSTTLSMSRDTDCLLLRLRPRLLSTVRCYLHKVRHASC